MMIRCCLPLACLVALLFVSDANAQQRNPGFTRSTPVSPYINLFRGNTGGGAIGNYFTLVRPMQNQIRFNQRQTSLDRGFQRQLMMMNQTNPLTPQIPGQGMGAPSMLRPGSQGVGQPTTAASFFNYSHFYGQPITGPSSIAPRTR